MVKVVMSTTSVAMAVAMAAVANTKAANDAASMLQLSGELKLNAGSSGQQGSGLTCSMSRMDMAKASLSAVKAALDAPEFCWRQHRKCVCKQWEPNHLAKCPEEFHGCVFEAARCPAGTDNEGELELCCTCHECDKGFERQRNGGCKQKCEGHTPVDCGPAACAQEGACVTAIMEMTLSVVDAVVSTVELFSPASGVMAAINVAESKTKKALQAGVKVGMKKIQGKMKKMLEEGTLWELTFNNFKKTLKSMTSHLAIKDFDSMGCKTQKHYMFGITVNEIATSVRKGDTHSFDMTRFDPTGFAQAVKTSAERGSGAAQSAAWLSAGGSFDPTGWLSVAAAFSKPKCKVETQAQQPFHKHTDMALCLNRGGIGGNNQYSANVGKNNPQACANHVHQVEGCGRWFDYGTHDGWCDCVKKTSGDCNIRANSNPAEYAVYEIREQQPFQKHADMALCLNRGGIGGNNQYSKNVGKNNPQGCADYVHQVQGCGRWFDYGTHDGWCDCVKETSGGCDIRANSNPAEYAVYTVGEETQYDN